MVVVLGVKAQGPSVAFGYDGISIVDTVSFGDTIYYSCYVVNAGNDVIAENILLETACYTQSQGLINTRTIGGQGPNFIFPGDSIEFVPGFLYEIVTQQNYVTGDNIVVIWPKVAAPVSQTTQYQYVNLYVSGSSLVSSVPNFKESNVMFHYSPITSEIKFSANKQAKKIQLFDLLGRTMRTYTGIKNSLNVAELSSGMYLINAYFEDGTSTQGKFNIQQ